MLVLANSDVSACLEAPRNHKVGGYDYDISPDGPPIQIPLSRCLRVTGRTTNLGRPDFGCFWHGRQVRFRLK